MNQAPNILFIMCDQLRADALGVASGGDGWVATPAIDRIAEGATRFDRAYTNSPVCVPARISLATGLYPHNYGLWANQARRSRRRATTGKGEGYALDPSWPMWMAALRDGGYRTALVGKTHLHAHHGDLRDRAHLLKAYGIDDIDEIGGPRASARVLSHMTEDWQRKGIWQDYQDDYAQRARRGLPDASPSPLPLEDYADVYVGRRSKAWLENYDGTAPWMLWASFGGPHEPWDAPEPYASLYAPEEMPSAIPCPEWVSSLPENCDTARRFRHSTPDRPAIDGARASRLRANYAGNVHLIDEQIAGILAAVESRGEVERTVIVFTADHGEFNGDFGLAHKSSFLDSAARIPLIIRTPETAIRGPACSSAPVELMDLGATLCDLAGVAWHSDHFARSLCAAVDDPSLAPRSVAIAEHTGEAMVCDGRYKAIYAATAEAYLLFDLDQDPHEQVNRIGEPELKPVQDRLDQALLQHLLEHQLQEPGPRCS